MGASESTGRINGTETEEEEERRRQGGSTGAAGIAIATAGAAVAAWGISRMLSDNEEKDEAVTHQGAIRNRHVDQTRTNYFGSGSASATPEANMLAKKGIWLPPPPNCVKMNTDGGFRPTEVGQPSAYGGILRNHLCECIGVFRGRCTGPTNSLEAEIFGILKGLELLARLDCKGGAILENDCDQAVFWIKGDNATHGIPKERMARCKQMIDSCRRLARENNIAIHNIDRTANKCADKLVRIALQETNHQVQTDLPDSVKTLVHQDKAAYYY